MKLHVVYWGNIGLREQEEKKKTPRLDVDYASLFRDTLLQMISFSSKGSNIAGSLKRSHSCKCLAMVLLHVRGAFLVLTLPVMRLHSQYGSAATGTLK